MEKYLESPHKNGSRQWRCEAETAGGTLRAQATRKQVFDKIKPILAESFFMPITPRHPKPRKDKKVVEATLRLWLEELGDNSGKIYRWYLRS